MIELIELRISQTDSNGPDKDPRYIWKVLKQSKEFSS